MEVADLLGDLVHHQKQASYHHAQSLRVLADYAIACEGDEFADAEIAALMHWTPRFAAEQLHLALALVSKLPNALAALEKGEIDLYKARILYDKTLPLTAELAEQVEERVLAKASEQTGAQMRGLTDRVVMRVDPEGARERAAERKQQRCTGIDAKEADMARLWAYLPANLATACYDRVDKIAKQAQSPEDPRTLDQIRADVVADLLLATPDQTSAVKVELYVTVSAATLLGLSEQPGEIAGYGPITPTLARELSADATWRRLLTDPISGEALEFGTSTYRPPAALQRYIWARDRTCRFPGCMRPAHKSELDHTVPFPEGGTDENNLGPFCKRHHRTKHRSEWLVEQPRPGSFRFRSPAGKTYVRHPEPVLGDPPPF